MAQQTTTDLDWLEALQRALNTLKIEQTQYDLLVGADVPTDCRMIITKPNSNPTAQTIELWEPHAPRPAAQIPIYRPYNYTKGCSTSAVAVLLSGSKKQLWAAVSGWDSKRPDHAYQLRAAEHIAKVRAMCASIGHVLANDWRDKGQDKKGQPGRFQACHVEKQVLAHLFEHRAGTKHARILLNFPPCADCHACLVAFVLATGVTVTVLVHGENDGVTSAAVLCAPIKIRYLKGGLVL